MTQETSAALIDQLVYFDNFMLNADTPNLDLDGQLSLDLAAFADDAFVFADEDKPDPSNMSDFEDETNSDNRENSGHNRPLDPGQNTTGSPIAFREMDTGSGRNEDAFPLDVHDRPGSSSQALSSWFQAGQNVNADNQSNLRNSGSIEASADNSRLRSGHSDKIAAAKRSKYHSHSSLSERGQVQNQVRGHPHGESHTRNPGHRNEFSQRSQGHGPQNAGPQLPPSSANPSDFQFETPQQPAQDAPKFDGEHRIPDLSTLPKYPVPPGAESSLKKAGLSQNQIHLLSALIAQHQTTLTGDQASDQGQAPRQKGNALPASNAVVPTLVSHTAARVPTGHRDSVAETSHYTASGLNRIGTHGHSASTVESPASMYTSDHSNSSTISGAYSPYKEASSGSTAGYSTEGGDDLSKRKRNTAASARFRVKKKMKEKEMEEKISQLSDTISRFEMRIDELEMENKFLKNLVIEKGNRQSDAELQSLKDKTGYLDDRERK